MYGATGNDAGSGLGEGRNREDHRGGSLALAFEGPVEYLDCDVEEPNGSIFLKPDFAPAETVSVQVPVVDQDRCTSCGRCAGFCRFNRPCFPGNPAAGLPGTVPQLRWLRNSVPRRSHLLGEEPRW